MYMPGFVAVSATDDRFTPPAPGSARPACRGRAVILHRRRRIINRMVARSGIMCYGLLLSNAR